MLEMNVKSNPLGGLVSDCLILGVFSQRQLTPIASVVDKSTGGALSLILKQGDMEGRLGHTVFLHRLPGIASVRVLLVGLGEAGEWAEKNYRESVRAVLHALRSTGSSQVIFTLNTVAMKGHDEAWLVRQATQLCEESVYTYTRTKSKKSTADQKQSANPLKKVTFWTSDASQQTALARAVAEGHALGLGVNTARELGNLPANICTPTYLAEEAQRLAKVHGMKCKILERKDCEKLGMGSFLSVSNGSRQPPKFIVLEYIPKQKTASAPVVLVGKGITFDTGGISLKPAETMDEMKFDMCGAASVLGTMEAVARLKLDIPLVGLIPATENMPGGQATKPGDIVTSMSGQTIEILNTDAEGRLILCDALTYAEHYNPSCVIDIATLTGACVVALGSVLAGLFSNQDALANEVQNAGISAYDRVWRMPLLDDYQEQLKSNFADMANIGGRPAGSVTAACFLSRFTKKYPWAHLDIAGVAWNGGKQKGSSGRPIPLLVYFLLNRAQGVPAVSKARAGKSAGKSLRKV